MYYSIMGVPTSDSSSSRIAAIHSIKAQADSQRTLLDRFADKLTAKFGTTSFLIGNVVLFAAWIAANSRVFGFKPFDPFPFNLLTMVVSLEAIVLSIVVLISQNRQAKVAEFREEVDLQVNLMAEKENIKMIEMLAMLLEKHGIDVSNDPEVREMLDPDREQKIESVLQTELNKDE
ncbi:MAG TPA: DUF1003 domain-containing protein [Fimbriimonas sp.]|nr:DUF1003 domain-containing protein [Fimbriimonas sp.]